LRARPVARWCGGAGEETGYSRGNVPKYWSVGAGDRHRVGTPSDADADAMTVARTN